jgi:hypothetical protein
MGAEVTAPATGTLTIQLWVAGKLINPLNARGYWNAIKEGLRWKKTTRLAWMEAGQPSWDGPATFGMTAYVGRLWDDEEGLGASLKYVRDEAVRLILDGNPPRRQDKNGRLYDAPANDGPDSGHVFLPPRQEVRPARERGVLVEISPR